MALENESQASEKWDGGERRESKRRYTFDRRRAERRKKYFWYFVMPTLMGVLLTAIITWGAYVTHVSFTISANYEANFASHVTEQRITEAAINHKIEVLRAEHNTQMQNIRNDMNQQLKEIRDTNTAIYRLLLQRTQMQRVPMQSFSKDER